MSLFITLFGGMALTAVLYGFGRLARLSNFWAAVSACGVPVFAYFGWAFATQPSLDAITLHVIAYPTVSVLLFQLYGERRHAQGPDAAPLHWAPLMMVGLFVVLTVIMGGFVYIAKEGLPPQLARLLLPGSPETVHTGFAGVVAHHDEAAKSISAHRNMDERLRRLGWQIAVEGMEAARAGQPIALTVRLSDRDGAPVPDARIAIALTRPGVAPAWLSLHSARNGHFERQLPAQAAGAWVAQLRISAQSQDFTLEKDLVLE